MTPNHAFPTPVPSQPGLTKREYIAAKALQGIVANTSTGYNSNVKATATFAVALADALLAELEKE